MTTIQSYFAIILSSSFLSYLVITLVKFLYKVWWTPYRIQSLMAAQGITGPPYKFMFGNTKAILSMKKDSLAKPIDNLSHDIFSYVEPHLHSWLQIYGGNFLMWFGPQPCLVVSEPELMKEILNNKDGTYSKTTPDYIKKLVGDGLGSSVGQKWSKMRKLANHTFHAESLKNMIPAMIVSTEMMLQRWKNHDGREVEMYEEFRLFSSEVISRTAFGSSYTEGKDIFDMVKKLGHIAARSAFKVRLPVISKIYKSKEDIEGEKLQEGIRKSILEIIRKREEQVKRGETDDFGSDFLGELIKANHETDESKKISVENVIDECKTFYFAGQETTNSLLSWIILLLGIHTDWQEEARKEVFTIFGDQNLNPEGIAKLKIIGMIIHETLRLYPPALGLSRKADSDSEVRLGKLSLPAGIMFHVPILGIHHDSNIWGKDAHLFKPERFSDGVLKATSSNTTSFFPFGIGPRTCVGFNFSITEAKIALSMMLQRYSFTLSPAYIHSPNKVLTLCPKHGVQVTLRSLKSTED